MDDNDGSDEDKLLGAELCSGPSCLPGRCVYLAQARGIPGAVPSGRQV